MPGAKGHLNERPGKAAGHVTLSPALSERLEREREARHRREAERQDAHRHHHRRIR